MTLLSVFANSYAADGTYAGWGNPANAYTDNGVYATRQANEKNVTYGNLFGFDLSALPDGATINSVTLSAEWHNSADDANGPKLILGVKTGGSSPGNATDITGQTTDEVHTYAPTGLTAAQLKATGDLGFWAILRFYRTDNVAHIAYLDYVKIEIDYTTGGLAEITGAGDITLDAIGQVAEGAVTVSGMGAIAFDGLTAGITGVLEITATGAITLDGLTADITGTAQEQDAITANASMTFDGLSASGSGAVIVTGESSNTFSSMSMDATGLVEVTGSASKALDGVTGEIIGVVGNAPVVGLLEGLFSGMTCQMVGVVTVSGTGGVVLDGISAWVTAWTEDVYSLQPGSRRRVKVPRPEPARAGVSKAMRHERQDSFKVEGD